MHKKLLLIAFALVCGQWSAAQEIPFFEGTLTYKVSLAGPQAEVIMQNEPNTQMQMHIKGGNYITLLKGGRYPKTFMFLADSNREYSVNFSEKIAYQYSAFTDRIRREKSRPTAVNTGKTALVNGVECQVYMAKTEDTQFLYFVNDGYRVNTSLFPPKIRARPFFLVPGLEGRIPLKVIKKQRGLTVTQEVEKIDRQEFDPEQFMIPPDFEVRKRDYRQ
ncbi:MAG: hypothetical protein D6730_15810 [Bacteroidetes bacterium]|nr:MAG: hypothetical protein D6730_15810 [Bacteroidota bacterium]